MIKKTTAEALLIALWSNITLATVIICFYSKKVCYYFYENHQYETEFKVISIFVLIFSIAFNICLVITSSFTNNICRHNKKGP
jgi:hypothetical protein